MSSLEVDYSQFYTLKNYQNILLLVNNGMLDYKYMAIFISEVEKLVIKDVFDFADIKILTTKSILKNNEFSSYY